MLLKKGSSVGGLGFGVVGVSGAGKEGFGKMLCGRGGYVSGLASDHRFSDKANYAIFRV